MTAFTGVEYFATDCKMTPNTTLYYKNDCNNTMGNETWQNCTFHNNTMPLEVNDYYSLQYISPAEDALYIDKCTDMCYADANCTSFYSIMPANSSYDRYCYFMNKSSQTQRLMENEGFTYFECRLD